MTLPFYLGAAAALIGGLLIVFPLLAGRLRKGVPLSLQTSTLLDGAERMAVEALLDGGRTLPCRDLLSLYWNSRNLLREAHSLWMTAPEDPEMTAMLEIEEDAHARTRRNLRLHLHERLGIARVRNATQVYSLFLLDSFADELTVIEHMKERLTALRIAHFKGAF